MAATPARADPAPATGGTVHVIATSLAGTRAALDAATALARGFGGRVVLFLRRQPSEANAGEEEAALNELAQAFRHLTASYTPRPRALFYVSGRATDVVQLFQSPGLVVIGGETRLWWPTAEQRLAGALTRLGCQVTFVQVPRRPFVPPLLTAARERAREAAMRGEWTT